ncbi:putative capsule polysaccharide export outer membrane protein precursor [Bradyrhizobium sp. ORS 278]|uniref:polysaccharide biosynthesis/export family protein n=1 Tax=Bradyrhizobium sp. (strain ORS 278) TaxID=114615 RepID=UPI0001507CBB|nr:polysaccharide biosynthesis/export family protein [Bradyrhizobium sp. ORS 278]CAL76059.1 putative capsule polysaccharide export outer membrane protein precursor [Bradyrhizobium sp. ORS 278]
MAGPASTDIQSENSTALPFAVVRLDSRVLQILEKSEPRHLPMAFADSRPPSSIRFGIGDIVSVTIFEATAGGLYIPLEAGVRPGNFVTIPDQAVDNDGNISVPYAGVIRAAGRTNVQIQEDILSRIKRRAIDPQVVVTSSQQRSSLVSVFGEVRTPVRFPMPAAGAQDRLTDAITRAGGISGPGWETWVVLERGGKRATVPFGNLVYYPSNNIFVQPGDRIYLYREPIKFLAFGATGAQGEFPFDAWRINLAQAVGKAGGLLDVQADPGSIFLYRRETREVAERLGVNCSNVDGDQVPIVIRVSFQDPSGYFLATKLQMRPFDLLYVANAPQVDVTKVLSFINSVAVTAENGITVANDFYVARANSRL